MGMQFGKKSEEVFGLFCEGSGGNRTEHKELPWGSFKFDACDSENKHSDREYHDASVPFFINQTNNSIVNQSHSRNSAPYTNTGSTYGIAETFTYYDNNDYEFSNNTSNNKYDDDLMNVQNIKHAVINDYWAFSLKLAENSVLRPKSAKLPLARIKRLMKVEEDIKNVAQEVPLLFALAAEKFVEELTLRSRLYTKENKRKILQAVDVQRGAKTSTMYDFLLQLIPDMT